METCCYAGRRINPQQLFSIQQRLWADLHLKIILGIFISKTSIGLQWLGRRDSNPSTAASPER